MRVSCFLALLLLASAGCGNFTQKFEEGFDKSFKESCRTGAIKEGAAPALANQYCDCALVKYKETKSMDKTKDFCIAQVKAHPPAAKQ